MEKTRKQDENYNKTGDAKVQKREEEKLNRESREWHEKSIENIRYTLNCDAVPKKYITINKVTQS